MKQKILNNWSFIRFVRLGLGIAITVQSAMANNWPIAILGLLFTAMTVFNIGCCGTGGCTTQIRNTSETTKDIIYEEVV